MAFFRRTLDLSAAARETEAPAFTVDIDPGTLYGVATIDEALIWMQGQRRISRREAIAVPAVKRARDLIAGGIGQLPLRLYDSANRVTEWSLLSQPEAGIPSTVTWTNTADDLLFSARSWLKVTHVGWHGKPAEVVKLDVDSVTAHPETRTYKTPGGSGSAALFPENSHLIRIDSPNDGLLTAGSRAIRALGRLEVAALNAADGIPPMDYFSPAEGADPLEDEDVTDLLNEWIAARKERRTAYVPAALKYNSNSLNPKELQLNEARELAVTEIARLSGVDSEELGVSTTSRTYANQQDRRKWFLDFTLGPYMRAIESRLSMDDVTPHGYTVRFDTSDFLRADDKTTAETDKILAEAKILTVDEIRARRGLEPLPAPAPTPAETPARRLEVVS